MKKNIELKSIQDLFGRSFYIPSYQRGYRWERQQVEDLLNDIWEFHNKDKGSNEIYCIQPLVVKKNYSNSEEILGEIKNSLDVVSVENILEHANFRWDVIDGQQRLTTIHILLSYLEPFVKGNNGTSYDESYWEKKYSIEYETRKDSSKFLNQIANEDDSQKGNNIDYYHMKGTFNTIKEWFDEEEHAVDKLVFFTTLINKVQFIWYETDEQDPIKVFTRLNIGKIALTDAELIKALFLNSSNFGTENIEQIRLQQVEIASEWDRIEYALQNDEFWLFIHNTEWDNPTRIDFIFDLMRDQKVLGEGDDGVNDNHQTFRYFYIYFQNGKRDHAINAEWIRDTWRLVKYYFQIFEEWYNDLELYHYVGYLIYMEEQRKKNDKNHSRIKELISLYRGNKEQFKNEIKQKIKDEICGCWDLTTQYELEGYPKKTNCRPLLILYNIQTVVSRNNRYADSKYKMDVFYKFPFHLLKNESWDVEHIDSNTTNELGDVHSQNEFLLNYYLGVDNELQNKIRIFVETKWKSDADRNSYFEEVVKQLPAPPKNSLSDELKNKICNFALLDSSTNRSYGNSIFPAKRRIIKGKDRGEYIGLPKLKNGKLDETETTMADSSFVPICTKQVFMKYYSNVLTSVTEYNIDDAKAYVQNINDVLFDAGFIKDQTDEIDAMFNQNMEGVNHE